MVKLLVLLGLVAAASALRARVPISEKVYLDGTQVWGKNIEESNACKYPSAKGNGQMKVCGKYTSVTMYMLANCKQDYGGHYVTLGPAGGDACVSSNANWQGEMQSYQVTFNAGGR